MTFPFPARVSNAELYRNQQAMEARTQASLKAIDDRITQSLGNTMRADVAQQVHEDQNRRLTNIEVAMAQTADHAWSTRSTLLVSTVTGGLASALTVLITLIVSH